MTLTVDCPICDKVFPSDSEMLQHCQNAYVPNLDPAAETGYRCLDCNLAFLTKDRMDNHLHYRCLSRNTISLSQSAKRMGKKRRRSSDSDSEIKDGRDDNNLDDDTDDGTNDGTDEGADGDDQIFSITLSPQQVLDSIARIIPALSPESPEIALLIGSAQEHVKSAPPLHIPAIQMSPTTWSNTNDVMDSLWLEAVRDELTVPPPETATLGLDMREDYFVKPMGSPGKV
ncbi:hypothetical protein J4E91_001293 [Alternaria rosae]|nr:hypothetical protein J4E91_001293 [Alternaria rosae]